MSPFPHPLVCRFKAIVTSPRSFFFVHLRSCLNVKDLPAHSHSVAAVLVSRGPNGELSPAEVSGFARVQQAVAKRAVIASPPPRTATHHRVSKTKKNEDDRGEKQRDSDVSPLSVGTGGGGDNSGVRYVTLQFDSVSGRTL